MELAGLKECLSEVIEHWNLTVSDFITDRHLQIRKYMRETYGTQRKDANKPPINHWLDVWHCAKGIMQLLSSCFEAYIVQHRVGLLHIRQII